MKIRAKLAILLVLYAGAFIVLLIFNKNAEDRKLGLLFREQAQERIISFRNIIGVIESSLETFAYDNTYWDEMVSFVYNADKQWAADNIVASFPTYKVNAAWVYDKNGALVYSASNIDDRAFSILPVPTGVVEKLFAKSRFCHFFIDTPRGPMEIRGATIHPSADKTRKSAPAGYFFAGCLWDKGYLSNLSRLTAARISVCERIEKTPDFILDVREGTIVFHKTLDDWRGNPIVCLTVKYQSNMAKIFQGSSQQTFLILVFYAIALFVILSIALIAWIDGPLESISQALAKDNIAPIRKIIGTSDEFGRIANLIEKFFAQYRELQDTQAQLVQSEKMAALGRFASGVAHEVKNPLAIILGGLEYVRAKTPSIDPEVREAMVKMREAVMRADIILKDLLMFARPSKLVTETVDPNALVRDAISFVELFKHKSDTAAINVQQELADSRLSVDVDRNQMQQALFNILLNAIEAMPMSGNVTVKTYPTTAGLPPGAAEQDGACVIEVSDTGTGIAAEDLPKLFEPFFTTKRDHKGTGLGLSIVKSIVEKHRGAITVDSVVGKGTTVRITLPATQKSA